MSSVRKPRRILRPVAGDGSAQTASHRIVLYTRQDCLLCDIAKQALDDFCRRRRLHYTCVEISQEPVLKARFGMTVPVVCVDGVPVCVTDFDATRLEPFLIHEAIPDS